MKTLKYKCTCVSGGGTEQESIWEAKKTDKTMRLKCIDITTIWGSAFERQVFSVSLIGKNKRHCLRIWRDDLSDFTLYPDRAGTPYHFQLIK